MGEKILRQSVVLMFLFAELLAQGTASDTYRTMDDDAIQGWSLLVVVHRCGEDGGRGSAIGGGRLE